MAFPSVNGRSGTTGSANATTLTAALPASIAKDELLIAIFSRDGTGAMTWGTGLAGWHILLDANDTGTAACKLIVAYKIADGSESGNLSLVSPSEAWCARTWRISGFDPNTAPAIATADDGGTGSTNPNPPSLNPADWGTEDTLWIAASAGDGNVAYTAGPGSYGNTDFRLATNATTGDRCALGCAERTLNAASEDPGTFTRGSEDWIAATLGIRSSDVGAHAQPILRSNTYYGTGASSYNNSFTLDAGSNRRLLIAVGVETNVDVSSITYNGVSASLVTDGTTSANIQQDTLARVTWWQIKESSLPSNGSATLAVTLSGTSECMITAMVVSDTDQNTNVAFVENDGTSGATSVSSTPTISNNNSLVLSIAYANNTPALTDYTIAGFKAVGRGSCPLPTAGAFFCVVAKGLTTESGAQTVTATASASVRMAMSTIVLAPNVGQTISPSGIASLEAFGSHTLANTQIVSPPGIPGAQVDAPVPSVRSSATTSGNGSAGTSVVLNKPSGVISGDLLVITILVDYNGAGDSFVWPSGFTQLCDAQPDNGSFVTLRFGVAWKLAGGSEPSTYTTTIPGNNGGYAASIQAVQDPHLSSPVNVFDVDLGSGTPPSSPISVTNAGATTTVNNCLVLFLAGSDMNVGDPVDATWAPNAGWTENNEVFTPAGSWGSHQSAYKSQPTAGAIGSVTSILTRSGDSGNWAAALLAVAPGDSVAAVGTPTVTRAISPSGVTSLEAIGSHTVANTAATVAPSGIASLEGFGTHRIDLNLTPSGVATLEAFGTLRVDENLVGTGIASLEGFGTHRLDENITLTGIVSAEAFGNHTLAPGAVTVSPTGISTLEAFGTHRLDLNVSPTGISTLEAFGAHSLALNLSLTGIASAETFGSHTLTPGAVTLLPSGISSLEAFGSHTLSPGAVSISPSGIASAELFGTARLDENITVSGIASLESLGTAAIGQVLLPTGITSAEASGTTTLTPGAVTISPSGIVTQEAHGTARLDETVTTTGIPTAEAFGSARLDENVTTTGIPTAEAFGNDTLSPGAVTITPSGVASGEAFGTAQLNQNLTVSGIASAEAFGLPQANLNLSLTGIASAETFGTATLIQDQSLLPSGIASLEAFGTHNVSSGGVTLLPTGIVSAEAFGTHSLDLNLSPVAIGSAETFGNPSLALNLTISGIVSAEAFGLPSLSLNVLPTGIVTGEAFGTTVITVGAVTIVVSGISSAEAFGTASLAPGLLPSGISSAEAFGTARLDLNLTPSGVATAEAFGSHFIGSGLLPVGIVSLEAFGSHVVAPGPVTVTPSGVPSAEQFGDPSLALNLVPIGIASLEGFGTAALLLNIAALSATSQETFGNPTLVPAISPTGIASLETFGNLTLSLSISPTGILSAEVLGNPALLLTISALAIPSAEQFGAPALILNVSPIGKSSDETFGTAQLDLNLVLQGILSGEAFGTPNVPQEIDPSGIASAENVPNPTLIRDNIVAPAGISSAEQFGTQHLDLNLTAIGVPTGEQSGTPTVAPDISPSSITSQEAVNSPILLIDFTIAPPSITSTEAFGTANLAGGDVFILPVGISSEEIFGFPIIDKLIGAIRQAVRAHLILAGCWLCHEHQIWYHRDLPGVQISADADLELRYKDVLEVVERVRLMRVRTRKITQPYEVGHDRNCPIKRFS